MLYLREFKRHPDRLSDLLPWAALVAPGVVLNKDGAFQATLSFRGPDLDSATEAELMSAAFRINNVLRRLGSGWAIYAEARRSEARSYPQSQFPDAVSYLIDEERRLLFEQIAHFESEYFLSLVYLPHPEKVQRIGAQFVERSAERGGYAEELTYFQDEITRIADLLETVIPEVARLSDEEILTYLHSVVSERAHCVRVPEVPMYLDSMLCDSPLVGGFEPRLGRKFLSVVSVLGFPGKSQPCILDRLDRLACDYRWITRFISLSTAEAEAELQRYKRQWFAKRKSIATLLKETFFCTESVLADSDAVNKALDADEALQELGGEAAAFGYFTATVVLRDEAQDRLKGKAREVERVLNSLGFSARIETTNALDAWLGTIPGNCRNNVRRPLLNTLNLAHLLPLSSLWAGPHEDAHLHGPALFFARTGGSTQFRFSLHSGDVGHTLVLGPTGAGKSVLLNLIEAQFRRYPDSQVYVFDKGGSAKVLTFALGGDYYELGADASPVRFQPLSRIDNAAELRWANDWICELLESEKVAVKSQ
ncbi:MAG TPA: conjugal transfer protein TrbE, partial [Oligoflexia bacterium]|nr:conjugal transfer protein TrbE [Oligoflexia bacterium]